MKLRAHDNAIAIVRTGGVDVIVLEGHVATLPPPCAGPRAKAAVSAPWPAELSSAE